MFTQSWANRRAGLVLNAFKANATRQLREDGLWLYSHSPWADKGSKENYGTNKALLEPSIM